MKKWMIPVLTSTLILAAGVPASASIDGDKKEVKVKPRVNQERLEQLENAWEAWAERYAKQWDEWGERFERRMESVGEHDAARWEEWAENYAKIWEGYARGVEEGRSPVDLDKAIAESLRGLKAMPLDDLQATLADQLGQLGDVGFGGLEGLDELIEMTVESALAGLEEGDLGQDVSGALEGSVGDILKTTEKYRAALNDRRRATDGEEGEQWRELRAALRGLEGLRSLDRHRGDDDDDDASDGAEGPGESGDHDVRGMRRARSTHAEDVLRQRIESLKRLTDDDLRKELIERLAKERAELSERESELDALRAEVERLRREVEQLKKGEAASDDRGVRF